jgi:hypothetical protein
MRKLLIAGVLALTLVLGLTVGSARFASLAAHIASHAQPMMADQCAGSTAPC